MSQKSSSRQGDVPEQSVSQPHAEGLPMAALSQTLSVSSQAQVAGAQSGSEAQLVLHRLSRAQLSDGVVSVPASVVLPPEVSLR